MKRKDAIEYITSWLRYGFGLSGKAKEVLKTAVKSMAELEKGSCKLKEGTKVKCEDVVSRDAVIKAVERNERCKDCKYCKRVYAQNDWYFHGCYCRPYTGKWIIEIENCPREIADRKEVKE